MSLYSTTYKQLSSSVSKFFSKLKVLRYRRSGGRTELSEHQNTDNFAENPNSMVPRAGLFSKVDLCLGQPQQGRRPLAILRMLRMLVLKDHCLAKIRPAISPDIHDNI